jgi:uncharacterized Zn finger protein
MIPAARPMKANSKLRFSIDVLREIAGEKVFARGEICHRDGQVQILAVRSDRVLAQVAGTEDYRGSGKLITHMATLRGAKGRVDYVVALETRFERNVIS